MSLLKALAGGLAGACILTVAHESLRRMVPDAPRMDLLGMRAIAKTMKKAGEEPPPGKELFAWTMAGDIISNSIYYSFAGSGKTACWRGALLGASAGAGAILLPGPLGLGEAPSNRTNQTKAMTFGLYLLGGLAAAAVGAALASDSEND